MSRREPFPNHDCIFCDDRKEFVLSDKGSKVEYRGYNKTRSIIANYRVEGGLIPKNEESKKCDHLLINHSRNKAFLVEIKGRKLDEAIKQLDTSLDALLPKIQSYEIHGRIVLTRARTPDLNSTSYKLLQKRLKKYGGTLDKKTMVFPEDH